MVKLTDVAAKAGCSVTTVSYREGTYLSANAHG